MGSLKWNKGNGLFLWGIENKDRQRFESYYKQILYGWTVVKE